MHSIYQYWLHSYTLGYVKDIIVNIVYFQPFLLDDTKLFNKYIYAHNMSKLAIGIVTVMHGDNWRI